MCCVCVLVLGTERYALKLRDMALCEEVDLQRMEHIVSGLPFSGHYLDGMQLFSVVAARAPRSLVPLDANAGCYRDPSCSVLQSRFPAHSHQLRNRLLQRALNAERCLRNAGKGGLPLIKILLEGTYGVRFVIGGGTAAGCAALIPWDLEDGDIDVYPVGARDDGWAIALAIVKAMDAMCTVAVLLHVVLTYRCMSATYSLPNGVMKVVQFSLRNYVNVFDALHYDRDNCRMAIVTPDITLYTPETVRFVV